uniref:Acyl carrier protein n=1 Tax=Anthurium amnicola TaxID=1678845 RepID=A0A1D1Y6J8_9ARAE
MMISNGPTDGKRPPCHKMQNLRSFLLKKVQINMRAPEHLLKRDGWLLKAAARHMSESNNANHDLVMARVLGLVKKYDNINVTKVTETADFRKDLGLDSLDRVEIVMAFEQEFSVEIPDEKADKLACCADVVNYIVSEAKKDSGRKLDP